MRNQSLNQKTPQDKAEFTEDSWEREWNIVSDAVMDYVLGERHENGEGAPEVAMLRQGLELFLEVLRTP